MVRIMKQMQNKNKEDNEEEEIYLDVIEWIFQNADLHLAKNIVKFNSEWRLVVGYMFQGLGLPFSTLLSVFHQRYACNNHSQGEGEGEGEGGGEDDCTDKEGCGDESTEKEDGGEGAVSTVECQTDKEEGGDGGPDLDCNSIEEIIVRLPLFSLMRAKSVCKSWNTAIGELMNVDRHIAQGYHGIVSHHIAQRYQGIVFFSFPLNRWFRIPLQWKRCTCQLYSPRLKLVAAGGGIFLFEDWNMRKFSVFNPLTKQHRDLPDSPLMPAWSSGLDPELITESDHFKVIVIIWSDERPFEVRALLYNSSTDKWTTISIAGPRHTSFSNSISTLHSGVVYCTNSDGLNLCCFGIDSGQFEFMEIEGGPPPLLDCHDCDKNFYASLPSLVVCNGKLILVGRLQRMSGEQSMLGRLPLIKHTLVGLWALDTKAKNKSWSLISATPRNLLEDTVKSSNGTDFQVCASDGMDQIWLILKGSTNMLSFNLSSMEWSVLPGCPSEDIMNITARRVFSAPLRFSSCF